MNLEELWHKVSEHYPIQDNKIRIARKATKPQLKITDRFALNHDFYYISDEFSLISAPIIQPDGTLLIILEGPHSDPTYGVRVPLLCTWSHLFVLHRETDRQKKEFIFLNNRWWEISDFFPMYYTDYHPPNSIACGYFYNRFNSVRFTNYIDETSNNWSYIIHKQEMQILRKNVLTLMDANNIINYDLSSLVDILLETYDINILRIIADLFQDMNDPFGQFIVDCISDLSSIRRDLGFFSLTYMLHELAVSVRNVRRDKLILLGFLIKATFKYT